MENCFLIQCKHFQDSPIIICWLNWSRVIIKIHYWECWKRVALWDGFEGWKIETFWSWRQRKCLLNCFLNFSHNFRENCSSQMSEKCLKEFHEWRRTWIYHIIMRVGTKRSKKLLLSRKKRAKLSLLDIKRKKLCQYFRWLREFTPKL